MKTIQSITIAMVLALAMVPAVAQEFKAGDITIERPWSRATPKGAPVAGGYMVIRNNGKTADRLIGGSFDVAKLAQIHEMTMQDGVMKMRQLPSGLEIPPGGAVSLTPSGDHFMLMGLKKQLSRGDTVKGSLAFEHAGTIPVELAVGGIGDMGPGGSSASDAPGSTGEHAKMQMQP